MCIVFFEVELQGVMVWEICEGNRATFGIYFCDMEFSNVRPPPFVVDGMVGPLVPFRGGGEEDNWCL